MFSLMIIVVPLNEGGTRMATINDRAANQRRYTDEPPRRNDRVTFLAAIGAAFVATVGFGVALTAIFVGRLVP